LLEAKEEEMKPLCKIEHHDGDWPSWRVVIIVGGQKVFSFGDKDSADALCKDINEAAEQWALERGQSELARIRRELEEWVNAIESNIQVKKNSYLDHTDWEAIVVSSSLISKIRRILDGEGEGE
jgi:hypothetical protein